MNSLNKRLIAVESNLTEPDLLKQPISVSNKTAQDTDISNYALFVTAIMIYVLASFYTLFPIINRRKKNHEIHIKIPLNLIEMAEIEALLKAKHKYINLYDENKENIFKEK